MGAQIVMVRAEAAVSKAFGRFLKDVQGQRALAGMV